MQRKHEIEKQNGGYVVQGVNVKCLSNWCPLIGLSPEQRLCCMFFLIGELQLHFLFVLRP